MTTAAQLATDTSVVFLSTATRPATFHRITRQPPHGYFDSTCNIGEFIAIEEADARKEGARPCPACCGPRIAATDRIILSLLRDASIALIPLGAAQNATALLLALISDDMEDQGVAEIEWWEDGDRDWTVVSKETGDRPDWMAALMVARAVLDGEAS